jgi:predicted DNA-binding transcriptional regulator YafY
VPRGGQLTRQWKLVRLLSGRTGRTLAQLQAELGVGKGTVQRDIAVLESAGFPITSEQRNGTVFWHLMEGFHVEAAVSLTLTEQMALYFSKGLLKPLQGTPIYESLESALQKIGAVLPPQSFQFLRGLDQAISVRTAGFKDYSRSQDIRFSRSQAPYIQERTWHPSQKIEKRADGSIELTVWVANLWEIKRWLIGYGADAQVLQPKELARDIEKECVRLLKAKKPLIRMAAVLQNHIS